MFTFVKKKVVPKRLILITIGIITILGFAIIFIFVLQHRISSTPQSTNQGVLLNSIIVPYTYNGDVYLVRGDGSSGEIFKSVTFVKKNIDYDRYDGYLSVHINSEQTYLVAVKAAGQKRGNNFEGASGHRLVSIDLNTGAEEILVKSQPLERIRCPQWSPDGKQIAFWSDDDYRSYERSDDSGIFLWDIEKKTLRQISTPMTIFWDSCEDMGTYLRWIDSENIAVYDGQGGSLGDTKGIWLVDSTKVTLEKIYDDPPLIKPYYSLATKNFSEKIATLPEDVITSLWGSVENPRAAPYWSLDKQFYFYHVMKEGFRAERWIERYDLKKKDASKIKTVWWSIYRE